MKCISSNDFLTDCVCSCHVTYVFQSESTLYSCLNVKEILARSRREIWRLSDYNWTRTQNLLVLKPILNHLAKLLKVDHTSSNILRAVFHKFYLVHSWILCPIYHYQCNFLFFNNQNFHPYQEQIFITPLLLCTFVLFPVWIYH